MRNFESKVVSGQINKVFSDDLDENIFDGDQQNSVDKIQHQQR